MYSYLGMFIISFLVSFLLTPVIVFLAMRNEVVDKPGERKVHKSVKPLIGGFAVFVSIFFSVMFFYGFSMQLTALLMSIIIIVTVGMVDDFHNMTAKPKLFGQMSAAAVLLFLSLSSFEPALSFFDSFLGFRFLSYAAVIIWIAAITNAFNLIDGLDGLATGSAIVTGLFLAIISMIHGNHWALGITLIILGSCFGFIPFNFQPARIFLGDTGSMLLGFSLAVIFLFNVQYYASFSVLFGGFLFFSYPVVDMIYAIVRRIKNRVPVFKADRGHIHHILLDNGFSVRQSVLTIYAGSFILGSMGILIIIFPYWYVFASILLILSVSLFAIRRFILVSR